jgi:lipopolysaccharide/colanic/teichoic acid biosynthesis glycosyltransferase
MDVWYVEHWSLWLDLRILAMTIVAVMTSRGVAPDVEAVESDLDYERRDRVPYS